MARCSIETGLPLDTWAAILGISPWEFNQCRFPVTKSAQCSDVVYQFPWQHDHLSREEIGEAIADAVSVYLTDGTFGREPSTDWRAWAADVVKKSGHSKEELSARIDDIVRQAEGLF